MKGYPSAHICLAAMLLAIVGQIFVELNLPFLQSIYTVLSVGTLLCWIVFAVALSYWVRSGWLSKQLSKIDKDLTKAPKYEDPTDSSKSQQPHL